MPDYDKLPDFHYKNVWETPGSINGKQRTIDDFQPRRQLENLFERNAISIDNEQSIDDFCSKFILKKGLVKKFIEQLMLLRTKKQNEKTTKTQSQKTMQKGMKMLIGKRIIVNTQLNILEWEH